MKRLIICITAAVLFGCGHESSPEGRSMIRNQKLQSDIDQLASQNRAMLDSIALLRQELNTLTRKQLELK